MLFASIDVGSNAARLLISEIVEKEDNVSIKKHTFVRVPLRLGLDVFESGFISENKINKLITTLLAFKSIIEVNDIKYYRACATAAMREAKNNSEIIKKIKKEIGLNLEVIDGIEEARIVSLNNSVLGNSDKKITMFIDVGGGSTEIIILKEKNGKNKIVDSYSFKIGTIKLLTNNVNEKEWAKLKDTCKELHKNYKNINCIGTGGNINKLIKMYGDEDEKVIYYDNLLYALSHLNSFSLEERISNLDLKTDRADVIVPATEIYLSIMKWTQIKAMIVPKIGLPDGLIYSLYYDLKNK